LDYPNKGVFSTVRTGNEIYSESAPDFATTLCKFFISRSKLRNSGLSRSMPKPSLIETQFSTGRLAAESYHACKAPNGLNPAQLVK
jgi:hypothetical protein